MRFRRKVYKSSQKLMRCDDLTRFAQFYVFLFQTANNIDLIHVLLQIAGQNIQIILRNGKAAVSQYLLERDHRAAHGDPFLCKGVPEAVNTGLFQPLEVAIVPQCMITAASGKLFPVD